MRMLRAFSFIAMVAILLGGFLSNASEVAAARPKTLKIDQTYSCTFPNGTFTIRMVIRYSADESPYVFEPVCDTIDDESWTDYIFVQINCDDTGEDFISAQIFRVDPSFVRNASMTVIADCRRTTAEYDYYDRYRYNEALHFNAFRSHGRVTATSSTTHVK